MTLGRTPAGAIKIKTDGGLRAVECACCGGGCDCGYATPINPPSDPDFTKKLHGDDPSVTPFTSVQVDFSVSSEFFGTQSTVASGQWGYCESGFYLPVKKSFIGSSPCGFCGGYGTYIDCPNFFATMTLFLYDNGCLSLQVREEYTFGGFTITGSSIDCAADNVSAIQINGVNYSSNTIYNDFGSPAYGSATITFS